MHTLFNKEDDEFKLPNMPGAEVYYFQNFLAPDQAALYFDTLKAQIKWQQDDIKVFGKLYKQPRLTALYANNTKPYSYSSITMHPLPFTQVLLDLKNKVEQVSGHQFTTCLLNYYRDGQDSNGWHADNEKELGTDPVIASLSFGASRAFKFRRKDTKQDIQKIILQSGSLLLMKGCTQHYWQHQLPKTAKQIEGRINITFRSIC